MSSRISPLADFVVRARESGRKRIRMGEYVVHIRPHHALFEVKVPENQDANSGKTNRRKRGA